MKPKAFSALTIALLFVALADTLQAADNSTKGPRQEYSKTINREFSTSADGMCALYNRHGKINANTWNKNSVKINITILVNAGNQSDADRAFDQIKVNFANSHGFVKAETMINDGNVSGCRDFQINYEVWMPVGNQLDLKNKYGNSYVGNLNGKLTAEIKYGDLRTETIGNDVDLVLGYGKASIEKLRNFYGQISYGGLVVNDGVEFQFDSKYSQTRISNAKIARITSKYDDLNFGRLGELRLQTKYSDVRIDGVYATYITAQYTDFIIAEMHEMLDADLTYGDLKVTLLDRNFSRVKVLGKYTDVEIKTEPGAAYRFEAEGGYTDLAYPHMAKVVNKTDSGTYKTVSGFGGDANAKGIISVKLSYGGFVLK